MDFGPQGRYTIVNGGSRGIGNTIARGLTSEVSATQWRRGLSRLNRRTHARAKYDVIGINYAELRKPDLRIARIIESALGSAQRVLNVGAGTGSYEPTDRSVIAVEPSGEMIRKRDPAAAKAIEASADDLPFDDKSFDASMAILTIHYWPDKEAGLREMRRVTRGRIVLLAHDPAHRPWLTDYVPELAALDEMQMPTMSDYERWLGASVICAGVQPFSAAICSILPTSSRLSHPRPAASGLPRRPAERSAGSHRRRWSGLALRLAEFRDKHHPIAPTLDGAAEHLLVMAPAIHVGGIEVIDAAVDGILDELL